MPHEHEIHDTDARYAIDPKTRAITNTSNVKMVIIQHDHNSECITFEIPRYIDGHDMMNCNEIQVHYINVSSGNRNEGMYEIKDLAISADDDEILTCSWIISKNATLWEGSLIFSLRFACVSNDEVVYAWGTAPYTGLNVSKGINNSGVIVDEYADILQQWRAEYTNILERWRVEYKEAHTKLREDIGDFAEQLGDVEAALDSIIAIQNELIGGESI